MAERQLFSGALFSVAEFSCPPADRAWHDVNVIASASPIVAFPRVPVSIRPAGARCVLATPNLAMLYNPGQRYERELRSERGDECLFVQLHAPAVTSLEQEDGVLRDGRMLTPHVPAPCRAYFDQHLLSRYLREPEPDALVVEETVVRMLRALVATAIRPALRRRTTRSSHHELAEAAKELVAAAPQEAIGLHEIAGRLGVSAFHLARVFRRETGYSLHQYRNQLRLRLALDRLPQSRGGLTALALELGFASHSHLTDTFRREFGVAPSAARNPARLEQLLAKPGTIAEAQRPAAA